jgi:hypothetical protein
MPSTFSLIEHPLLVELIAQGRAINVDFYPFGCKKSSPKKASGRPGGQAVGCFFLFFSWRQLRWR